MQTFQIYSTNGIPHNCISDFTLYFKMLSNFTDYRQSKPATGQPLWPTLFLKHLKLFRIT